MAGKGLEIAWTKARRHNGAYITNKVVSFMISSTLSVFTLSYKPTVYKYQEATDSFDYTIIYWMLFIFYAFQALDELIELYSALAKREKGALGLLFEMNYFIGFGLIIWIIHKVFTTAPPQGFEELYNFLYYQVIVFFCALGVSVLGFSCFTALHLRNTRRSKIN